MLFCWESGFPKEHHSKQNKKLPCRRSVVLEGSSLFSECSTSLFIYLFFGELKIERRFSLPGYFLRGEAGEPGGTSRSVS